MQILRYHHTSTFDNTYRKLDLLNHILFVQYKTKDNIHCTKIIFLKNAHLDSGLGILD